MKKPKIRSFHDLIVWQRAVDFSLEELTEITRMMYGLLRSPR
jgi:hypothetical protein